MRWEVHLLQVFTSLRMSLIWCSQDFLFIPVHKNLHWSLAVVHDIQIQRTSIIVMRQVCYAKNAGDLDVDISKQVCQCTQNATAVLSCWVTGAGDRNGFFRQAKQPGILRTAKCTVAEPVVRSIGCKPDSQVFAIRMDVSMSRHPQIIYN